MKDDNDDVVSEIKVVKGPEAETEENDPSTKQPKIVSINKNDDQTVESLVINVYFKEGGKRAIKCQFFGQSQYFDSMISFMPIGDKDPEIMVSEDSVQHMEIIPIFKKQGKGKKV